MTMNRTISWTEFWKAPERWHREPEPELAFSVQSKVANLILMTGWTEQWVLCTAFHFQSRLRNLTDLSLCSFFTIKETLMMSGDFFFSSCHYEEHGKSFYFQNTEVKLPAAPVPSKPFLLQTFWSFLDSCVFRVTCSELFSALICRSQFQVPGMSWGIEFQLPGKSCGAVT